MQNGLYVHKCIVIWLVRIGLNVINLDGIMKCLFKFWICGEFSSGELNAEHGPVKLDLWSYFNEMTNKTCGKNIRCKNVKVVR